MFSKIKRKLVKFILCRYAGFLFKDPADKNNKIILTTDLYLDGEISIEDWKKNINKILELK